MARARRRLRLGAWAVGSPPQWSERFVKPNSLAGKPVPLAMLVDVPKEKVANVTQMIKKHHPEADMHGVEPTIPAFP